MRRLLIAIALAACTPAATAPTQLPTVTAPATVGAVPSVPTRAPTPSPTVAATSTPAATDTPRPTDTPTPLAPQLVHNDGQKIIAAVDRLEWSFGEGSSSPATQIANYRLNGRSLAGSALTCTALGNGACAEIQIIPALRLLSGVTYTLALLDTELGTFVAQDLTEAKPHVVSAKATQFTLTVTFDMPMLHTGDCGATSWSLSVPGTITFVRGAGGFPAPAGAFTALQQGYREYLANFISQADVSADCYSVTFGSGWGAPAGDVDLLVGGVEDVDGNLVEPATFHLTIADEAVPKLMFANLELQTAQKKVIRVAFSEAMDEASARDASHYRLNGAALPSGTVLECELASCTWVRLTFAPSAFVYGASNTLSVSDVRDLAGKTIVPATSAPFQVF